MNRVLQKRANEAKPGVNEAAKPGAVIAVNPGNIIATTSKAVSTTVGAREKPMKMKELKQLAKKSIVANSARPNQPMPRFDQPPNDTRTWVKIFVPLLRAIFSDGLQNHVSWQSRSSVPQDQSSIQMIMSRIHLLMSLFLHK